MATYNVSSGVTSTGITLSNYDSMCVSSGGVVNSTTVNSSGYMHISSGGVANSTTVNSSGYMYISSGGVANSITVNSGGDMVIYAGGTATDIVWTPCVGYVEAHDGAYVTYASHYSGVYLGSNNQLLSSAQIVDNKVVCDWNGSMFVMNDGVANNTTLAAGRMYVFSGGTASSTTVNDWGWMNISSGGSANAITIQSNGSVDIYRGGAANNVTVNAGGYIFIASDSTITDLTVKAGGNLGGFSFNEDKFFSQISNGSAVIAPDIVIVDDAMHISSDVAVDDLGVNSRGNMYIHNGGKANNTSVNEMGTVIISNGGIAQNTTVKSDGRMHIASGGTASNTTVNDWGTLFIDSGGIHRGSLQIEVGEMTVVMAEYGAIIDFTVAGRTTDDGYLINNIEGFSVTPTYTITVSADQAAGVYKLAQGAANFTGTVSIGDWTTQYGSIAVNGDTFEYNDVKYTLTQTSGNLLLNVERLPAVFIYSSGTLVSSGTEINNAIITSGRNDSMHISYGGSVYDAVVSSNGSINVYNGGVADQTTIGRYGSMYISSGGIACDTLVDSHGSMYVSKAGLVSSTTVEYGAELYISSGGTAYDAVIKYGGTCAVSSGGYASGIEFKADGHIIMAVASDTYIQGVSSGSTFEMKNARLDNYTANGGSIYIHSGASANNTRLNNGGIIVRQDGVANNTIARGQVTVLNGGGANYTTAYAGMTVSSGGSANYTVAEKNCYIYISSGGIASNTTINGGFVSAIGTVKDTIVNSGGVLRAVIYKTLRSTAAADCRPLPAVLSVRSK